jgi:subtilisin family serine protease
MRKIFSIPAAAILLGTLLLAGCAKEETVLTKQQLLPKNIAVPSGLAPLMQAAPGAKVIKDAYIVVFRDEMDESDVDATVNEISTGLGAKAGFRYKKAMKGFSVTLPAPALEKLRANPNVKYIEQDQVVTAFATQTGATWGIDRTDQVSLPLSGTYTYNTNGSTADAYIFDTGIRQDHAEFGGRAKPGYDAILSGGTANDGNGHGTHVAGTVGGSTYGMAKNITLYAVKVLGDNGSGSYSGVIAGIDWAVGHHTTRPAVGNMSLGGGISTSVEDAVRRAVADGIVMCVAAGNNYQDASGYSPARTPEAITVGATTSTDGFASYSNFGSVVDILAPGSSITSSWYTSSTAINTISGTSMATPHVAGAAALYLEANPGATVAMVENGLKTVASTNKIGSVPAGTANRLLYTQFTTVTPTIPSVPTLVSPANGATGIATSTSLTWNASAGAASYNVQVSTTPDFSSLLNNSTVTSTSLSLTGLAGGTVHYWRVSAANTAGTSAWSEVRSFTTVNTVTLATPVPVSPANGAVNVSTSPAFSWNASTGAISYQLQVSTKSNFSVLVLNRTGITTTSSSVTGLRNNTNYYWRIRASNGTILSGWSAVRSFKTIR